MLARPDDAPAKLMVQFHLMPVQNAEKSIEAKRPIFEEVDYIRLMVAGDKDNIVDRPVWDDPNNPNSDTSRFGRELAAWKAGKADQSLSGTPLSEWPGVTRSQVEELAYFNVKTVEQLSAIADGNLQKMGAGFLALRQKALDFLDAANAAVPTEKFRAELSQRDNVIETLKAQLASQQEAISNLQKSKKAG